MLIEKALAIVLKILWIMFLTRSSHISVCSHFVGTAHPTGTIVCKLFFKLDRSVPIGIRGMTKLLDKFSS
jgi:hypothetical protein